MKTPRALKPLSKPVHRRYFGVAFEYKTHIVRSVYNEETDAVDEIDDISAGKLFRCQALGSGVEEASTSGRKAFDKMIESKGLKLVEDSVKHLETLDFAAEPKEKPKLSFV